VKLQLLREQVMPLAKTGMPLFVVQSAPQ